MKANKSLGKLSADELFDLARQRQREEAEAQKEGVREEIAALEAKKRDLTADYKAAVVELDKEIRKLRRKIGASPRRAGGGRRSSGVSARLLELVGEMKKASTRDLKVRLESEGVSTKYIAQTLANLKRQGKVKTVSRGIYTLA